MNTHSMTNNNTMLLLLKSLIFNVSENSDVYHVSDSLSIERQEAKYEIQKSLNNDDVESWRNSF